MTSPRVIITPTKKSERCLGLNCDLARDVRIDAEREEDGGGHREGVAEFVVSVDDSGPRYFGSLKVTTSATPQVRKSDDPSFSAFRNASAPSPRASLLIPQRGRYDIGWGQPRG